MLHNYSFALCRQRSLYIERDLLALLAGTTVPVQLFQHFSIRWKHLQTV